MFEKDLLACDFEGMMEMLHHRIPRQVDPEVVLEVDFKLKLKQARIDLYKREYHAVNGTSDHYPGPTRLPPPTTRSTATAVAAEAAGGGSGDSNLGVLATTGGQAL